MMLLFGATDWSLHRISADVGATAGAHHWLAAAEHGEYIPYCTVCLLASSWRTRETPLLLNTVPDQLQAEGCADEHMSSCYSKKQSYEYTVQQERHFNSSSSSSTAGLLQFRLFWTVCGGCEVQNSNLQLAVACCDLQ
jgi:hypothetical protein